MFDLHAWVFIAIGILAFASHFPLEDTYLVNFPAAVTVLQTAGLMFSIFGIQMLGSQIFWPQLSMSVLMTEVIEENNTAAGLVIFGLLVFNGLSVIGFAIWLTHALGAGVSAG